MFRTLRAIWRASEIDADFRDAQTAADGLEVLLRAEIDAQCIALTSAVGIDLNGLACAVITAAVGAAEDQRSACETTA
jgi:hypothetical protein